MPTVIVTPEQIPASISEPIVLVPAPGEGKVIKVLSRKYHGDGSIEVEYVVVDVVGKETA